MSNPLVSVIIPAHNSMRYIGETIESVLAQSYSNLEVIVVDDGSTDQQGEIILSLASKDSRIRYFSKCNQGVSNARNTGFNLSKGDYVAFLDADDVWLPDNLSEKIEKIQSGNFGLVHSDASIIDEDSKLLDRVMKGGEGRLLSAMLEMTSTQVPGPSSIVLKRSTIKNVGLFDTRLSTSADQDFFLRFANFYPIGRVSKPTWKYRIHSNNMHKNIALMEHDVLAVYKKASINKQFSSWWYERKCYSSMYLILAASWIGDGKNWWRGFYFTILAFLQHPDAWLNFTKRILKQWK
jgi:glycosyltransferase involved in cell wall biosynthesis